MNGNNHSLHSASMDQQGVINLSLSALPSGTSQNTSSGTSNPPHLSHSSVIPAIPAVAHSGGAVGGIQLPTRPVNLRLAPGPINGPINFSSSGMTRVSQPAAVAPRGSQMVINAAFHPLRAPLPLPVLPTGALTVIPGKIPIAQVAGRVPVKNLTTSTSQGKSSLPGTTQAYAPLLTSLTPLTPLLQQASDNILNAAGSPAVSIVSTSARPSQTAVRPSQTAVRPSQTAVRPSQTVPRLSQTGSVSILSPKTLKEILPKIPEHQSVGERARTDLDPHGASSAERSSNNAFISHILRKQKKPRDKVSDLRREVGGNTAASRPIVLTTSTALNDGGGSMTRKDSQVESMLEWSGSVGVLPGTAMKFKKNEFGLLELIPGEEGPSITVTPSDFPDHRPEVQQESLLQSSALAPQRLQNRCLNCNAPRALYEGKFCSRSCLQNYNKSMENVYNIQATMPTLTSIPLVQAAQEPSSPVWPLVKKKKRKICDIIEEEPQPRKVPKLKIKIESDNKTTAEVIPVEAHVIEPKMEVNCMASTSQMSASSVLEPLPSTITNRMDTESFKKPEAGGSGTTIQKKEKTSNVDSFSWQIYMEKEYVTGAPIKCFRSYQDVPQNKNQFRVGMKLEAIDPKHPDLYCAVTVAEIKGYRLRLHFDGYSESYDFWVNADSPFIFPCGWSQKNSKMFSPPKGFDLDSFDWGEYLKVNRSSAATKAMFSSSNKTVPVTPISFRTGMKLEALDKKNSHLLCVATVKDILGDLILIHFDGWENIYDFWCEPSSQYIHPIGYCQDNHLALSPPPHWGDWSTFTWEKYLEKEKALGVPARAFKNRPPNLFEAGQKLEVVDKRNPQLTRVATVAEIQGHSLKIHFDGWSDVYDYFVDVGSPDIHPVGWCTRTGHELTPPPSAADHTRNKSAVEASCPTPGCTGVGHIKGPKYVGHHSSFGCPYSAVNLNRDPPLLDRLVSGRSESEGPKKSHKKSESGAPSTSAEKKPTAEPGRQEDAGVPSSIAVQLKKKKMGSDLEEANAFMLQHFGKPLYGKGSGRGRKKTLQKLMKQVSNLKKGKYTKTWTTVNPTATWTPGSAQHEPMESDVPGMPSPADVETTMYDSVFLAPPVISPYQPFPLAWDSNANLLPKDLAGLRATTVRDWTTEDVTQFVEKLLGSNEFNNVFTDQQIDGEALLILDQSDMKQCLKLKLGPTLKLHNALLKVKENSKRLLPVS